MKVIKFILVFLIITIIVNACSEDFLKIDIPEKPNVPPISNAGLNQSIVLPLDSITLSGINSSDEDGKISFWKWEKKSGPQQLKIVSPTDSITNVNNLTEGEYIFTLTIIDNDDASSVDSVQVNVGGLILPAPTISSFTPTTGAVGTSVVINGKNYNSPTVSFNGVRATVKSSTSTSITTSVPNGATTGKITVISNNKTATSSTDFTVTKPQPTITSFSPTNGSVGTSVTITGTNFSSPTVSFNGISATVTSSTSTSILTSVPNGATTGKITVVVGNTTLTSSTNFTIGLPQPTITSFTPTSGLIGSSVTITGTNFNSPTVSFNGILATITSSTSTSISTTVPTNATTGSISVTSNGYTVYSTNVYTVTSPPTPGELYFSGDMQNVTVTRSGSGYKLNGWPDLYSQVNDIYLNNLATADTYAYQQMVTDPAGSGRTVMMGRILDSDPSQPATSRAQMTISYKSTTNLPVYHSSHRMYIHPDLKYLEQYPGVADWFSLVEIWTVRDANMDGDPAGSARWGLSLHKSSATGSPLFWHLYGEYMQPASKQYQDFWAYDNKTFAVPFGKWFTLDIYLKRGTGTAGQFKITVTPDGGTTTTVFDVSGDTQYPNRPDLYLDDWQPFKLYIGDQWMDWMRGNGKYMSIYYNDYKWYKN